MLQAIVFASLPYYFYRISTALKNSNPPYCRTVLVWTGNTGHSVLHTAYSKCAASCLIIFFLLRNATGDFAKLISSQVQNVRYILSSFSVGGLSPTKWGTIYERSEWRKKSSITSGAICAFTRKDCPADQKHPHNSIEFFLYTNVYNKFHFRLNLWMTAVSLCADRGYRNICYRMQFMIGTYLSTRLSVCLPACLLEIV